MQPVAEPATETGDAATTITVTDLDAWLGSIAEQLLIHAHALRGMAGDALDREGLEASVQDEMAKRMDASAQNWQTVASRAK